MAIEVGMPTNFYHYTAKYEKGHYFTSASSDDEPIEDTGVFVVTNPRSGSDFMHGYVSPSDYRCTSHGYYSLGGLNMETTVYSNKPQEHATRISIAAQEGNPALYVFQGEYTNINSGICKFWKTLGNKQVMSSSGALTIHKTELACPYSYERSGVGPRDKAECVYATGISAIMQYSDGTQKDQTVIIVRLPPSGKDYPVIGGTKIIYNGREMYSGDVWSKDGSVIIYNDGTVEQTCITGNTLTSVTATEVSLAMSDSVLKANDGVLAVACMVSGDGHARWLGYKNGIYKFYQGPTPLVGMPGEKITIKGHEFVCLAYGPFYARLS